MKSRAMTLIELTIVLALLALSTLILIPLATEGEKEVRIEKTEKYTTAIKNVFDASADPQGYSRFLSDMGRYPVLLRNSDTFPLCELYDPTCFVATQKGPTVEGTFDLLSGILPTQKLTMPGGWNGPYIEADFARYDAWKQPWTPLDNNAKPASIGAEIHGIQSTHAEMQGQSVFFQDTLMMTSLVVNVSIIDPSGPSFPQTLSESKNPNVSQKWSPQHPYTIGSLINEGGYIYRANAGVYTQQNEINSDSVRPVFPTEYRQIVIDSQIRWEMMWPTPSEATRVECQFFWPQVNVYRAQIENKKKTMSPNALPFVFKNILPGRKKIIVGSWVEVSSDSKINIHHSGVQDILVRPGSNVIDIKLYKTQ